MESLRLFFSYGHEENCKIVNRIKDVLTDTRHKHQVWIDEEQIRHSSDWRQKIVKGINESDEVVAFLSSYALNKRQNPITKHLEDGVCRDELSIAVSIEGKTIITILLESEKKIDIPTTISGIQWLDMSDWREKYDVDGEENGPVFSAYFEEKMAQILDVIETPENFKTEGEIKALRMSLLPTLSRSKYCYRLKKEMIGRQWLIEEFDHFISNDYENRFLYISGGPGYGKSHFITHTIHFRPEVIAGYFFDWSTQTENSIKDFICEIAFQIATRLPMFRENLLKRLKETGLYISGEPGKDQSVQTDRNLSFFREKTPAGLFSFLISDLLARSVNGNIGNRLIVIDGVDEADFHNDNPLIRLLCDDIMNTLPEWCKIVITSRNEALIEQRLKILHMHKLDLDCEASEKDINRYLHYRLDRFIEDRKLPADIVERITGRCERTFIFAEMLCNSYEDLPDILDDPDNLPDSIAGLYTKYFDRLFCEGDFSEVRTALEVIAANGGKIDRSVFMSIMEWSNGELNRFVAKMKSFLNIYEENTGASVGFYHKTVSEWLSSPEQSGVYALTITDGEKTTAAFCGKIASLFTAENTSIGFNGKKLPAPYGIIKFAYENTFRFGTDEDRRNVMYNLPFLYAVQLQSYIHSDLKLSYSISDDLNNTFLSLPSAGRERFLKFYIASKNAIGEIELAKDNVDTAQTIFEELKNEYEDVMKQNFTGLYRVVECNLCFCIRRTDVITAEKRLNDLSVFIDRTQYESRENDRAMLNYHHCIILYDKATLLFSGGKLEESERNCSEAIACAEKAISISDKWFESNDALKSQCFNQIGSCYYRLAEIRKKTDPDNVRYCYEKQLEYKSKSLKTRLDVFGKYNRYTANAYDYKARALLDLYRWDNKSLPAECYECAENAIKLNAYVFGKSAAPYARSLQTRIYILEYEGRYAEALPLAQEQYAVYSSYGSMNSRDLTTAKKLLDRIIAHSEEADGQKQ